MISKSTVGAALFTPTRPVVVIAVLVVPPEFTIIEPVTSNATVGATDDPTLTAFRRIAFPVTSSGAVGEAVAIPTFPVVVNVELTLTSPVMSNVTNGGADDPIRILFRMIAFPVTSSGAVGEAVAIPTFPTVVKVELTFTAPVTSKATVGATDDPTLTAFRRIEFPVTSTFPAYNVLLLGL